VNFLSQAKISLLKTADSALGKALVKIIPPPSVAARRSSVDSILVIRPGGIGDALLLAPALNAIKERFPAASITILAERRNSSAFKLIPAVSNIFLYDSPAGLIHVLRRKFDMVIDSEQWHRLSAIIARFISAELKIGYDTNERGRQFTHRVKYSHDDYEATSFLNLLEPIGITAEFDPLAPFLSLPDSVNGKTDDFLSGLNRPFITLFPGASIPERRWGWNNFRKLVMRLADQGVATVVVGGEQDSASGEGIISGTYGVNLAGKTTLAGTASIISSSALLVSGDSGVLHLGVGLGVPTVSIFGPGISKKWAPRGDKHTVLEKKFPCSPCTRYGYTPRCNYNVRCMADISPDDVFAAVIESLHSNAYQE
jgi:ADP-heptose:LPS heptosyltransferase